MSLFDDYLAWAHGSRIELVNGKLVIGKSLSHSRLLLHQILRGWGLEAAIALAPESMWWSALSAAFAPALDLTTLTPLSLQTWADHIQFQPGSPLDNRNLELEAIQSSARLENGTGMDWITAFISVTRSEAA